jgi:hypothetical protein
MSPVSKHAFLFKENKSVSYLPSSSLVKERLSGQKLI